jgi:cell division protein FtsW
MVKKISDSIKKAAAPVCPWPLPPQGIDVVLLLTIVGMVLFGLLMVYSSSFIYAQERTGDGFAFIKKQLLFSGLGFGALVAVCRVDYRKWSEWAYLTMGLALVLLAAVFVPGLGTRALGAQRWIHLGPIGFQPGEFAKFAVIIFVAHQLDRKKERLHTLAAGVISHFLLAAPAFLLLLLQPDFGSTVIICTVMFALLFLAGVPRKYLVTTLLLAGIAGVMLAFGSAYRRDRVMTFMDPWRDPAGKGFQIIQSLLGLHNGALSGVGLGNGKEKLFCGDRRGTGFPWNRRSDSGLSAFRLSRPPHRLGMSHSLSGFFWNVVSDGDHLDSGPSRVCKYGRRARTCSDERSYASVY